MKHKRKKNHHTTKETHLPAITLTGTLDVTRSGVGYVIVENKVKDILIRQENLHTALHGDTVKVKIVKENYRTGKSEGKITEVIARKQVEFIGRLQRSANFAFCIPNSDKPMPDIFIPLENIHEAQNGERVVVRLIKWEKGDKKPIGKVVSILSAEDENDIAMKEILAEAGFPLSFPDEVMKETNLLPEKISVAEINKRKDYRNVLTFTIDPVDAKDFDDAISIKAIKNDLYEIGVHIADVSHFVTPSTKLDEEGYKRATSVYLPDRVNPMLPEKISNDLCSLKPNEDRLTFSAVFEMNTKGVIKNYWLGKTIIHSDKRFTYEDVQQTIETNNGLYKTEILLLNNIAQQLRASRFKKGAINFSSQEVRFQLDEKGKPIGIVVKQSKESHQLIEEFMLLANRTVAEHVSKIAAKNPIPFPYRVHDQPDEEKLQHFAALALKYGYKLNTSSPEKIAESFNAMLEAAKGKPEQQILEQLGIRTMAKAVYTTNNIGHYGLAFKYYCHFTSPIRRYPDILVHRTLQSLLQEKPVIDKKMEEKCRHCSENEKAAMDCERSGNKYKQVEFLKDHVGEIFEGVISGVAAFGLFVETIEHKCEGLVSYVSLTEFDDFRLVESDYCLVGKNSNKVFRMGDKILIKVIAANVEKKQLDFEWIINKEEEQFIKKIKGKKKLKKKK
ncbi:MAG: ribonuclease R [Chitinophagaceae bacterium]|nr:ribonuclease R [Chitinophagaceae bacterium]MCW5905881.1 ribonuclease R [Chitinophagaceae bacterium]